MSEILNINDSCNKYSKAVIYYIYNINTKDIIYVGSTINFKKRINKHNSQCKKLCNIKPLYITINNNWNEWIIEKYEDYSCNNRKELTKREGDIKKILNPSLNKNIPGRNLKEWYIDNREKRLKQMKELYINNKEKRKEYQKQYYKKKNYRK